MRVPGSNSKSSSDPTVFELLSVLSYFYNTSPPPPTNSGVPNIGGRMENQ